mmetsp:Transcript_17398/g.44991  ORF Transcript_17398/g.44991 Transcript_17398/m.44991 type:complete len:284 (+) Transcript_17398:51-902(+)
MTKGVVRATLAARAGALFATHNIMDGLRLPGLLRHYAELATQHGHVAALCIQENKPGHAEEIAATLGGRYRAHHDLGAPRLATVYDADALTLHCSEVIDLPKIDVIPTWQRLYIASPEPEQKHASLLRFERTDNKRPLLLANFHLDAAGTNHHRGRQLHTICCALRRHWGPATAVIACGDTNAFSFDRRRASAALRRMLAPLEHELGAMDVGADQDRNTHYFWRANEPKLGQRIAVFFGQFGVDFPCRYDVLCTNLEVLEHGQVETLDSDHDLVYARVAWKCR